MVSPCSGPYAGDRLDSNVDLLLEFGLLPQQLIALFSKHCDLIPLLGASPL